MDNPPLEKGGEGGFKSNNATFQQEIFESAQGVLEKNMVVFVILKISPIPSFPKRGLRVSTGKSEEPL